jgi:hypothetical protein
LLLNQEQYTGGDDFMLKCRCINTGPEVRLDQYILLDVMGEFFFWPEWSQELQFSRVILPQDQTIKENILQFTWPQGDFGTVNGLRFWGTLMQPGTTRSVAPLAMTEFGYY